MNANIIKKKNTEEKNSNNLWYLTMKQLTLINKQYKTMREDKDVYVVYIWTDYRQPFKH